jgi:hypothetical protein
MTSKVWDQMQWGDRVRWRGLAVVTVLQPADRDVIPGTGAMNLTVERGYRTRLVTGA